MASGDPYARQALAIVEAACEGQRGGQEMEYACESPDNERWFLMRAEPLRRIDGGAVVSHIDITARKMVEMALRESEQRFRRMAESLPVGVWMSDEQGLCTYFNQYWLQMSGRALEEEVGNGWLEAVHPDDRAGCMETYLGAFHARRRFEIEYRIRRFDGEYRWIHDIGMPRYSSDGTFHGYVGGAVDMTERRDAEQLLRDFNRKLILAQEEERRHIARELHDHLNQQLALLAVELQQLSLNPPGSVEALTAALQEEWRRTSDIASDVHAISHRLHPSKLEALGLVTTLRAHCRDLSRQNLEVHFSEQNVSAVPPDLSLCLFRVAEEALTNVIRHSGATQADVSLTQTDGEIVLRVADAGCGFKVGTDRLRGLGLISIRERIHAVGGKVTISSAFGSGTTVEARLPRGGRRSASTTQQHQQRRPKPRRSNVADPA
jgi:PAS domain S-box-containing protein